MPDIFPWWVVITHFLNIFLLLLLARSGLEVLSAFARPAIRRGHLRVNRTGRHEHGCPERPRLPTCAPGHHSHRSWTKLLAGLDAGDTDDEQLARTWIAAQDLRLIYHATTFDGRYRTVPAAKLGSPPGNRQRSCATPWNALIPPGHRWTARRPD
jgi:hypothetical protein